MHVQFNPINGRNLWEQVGVQVHPPEFKDTKKNLAFKRKPEEGESSYRRSKRCGTGQVSRKGQKHTCSKCGGVGHTKKTCKISEGPTIVSQDSGPSSPPLSQMSITTNITSQGATTPMPPTSTQQKLLIKRGGACFTLATTSSVQQPQAKTSSVQAARIHFIESARTGKTRPSQVSMRIIGTSFLLLKGEYE
ncbi:hypothetical protein Cgig2_013368 [Carnegiea gigantea]|uniref:Uncharacterized protein n=1 Tax=Carnegiea gigantea TaxID=171969 RepID=A0A9Q1K7I6_9CARY|nr:hypothetical protein Cgig2_013368 [Carnegiea gigantea]